MASFVEEALKLCTDIDEEISKVTKISDMCKKGNALLQNVVPLMTKLRDSYDNIEKYLNPDNLPYPTYRDLFSGIE